jgi:hypothetical protein
MNYIVIALLFAVIFYSFSSIRYIVKSIFDGSGNLYNVNSYAWFWSLLIINLIIIIFIYGYSWYKNNYSLGDMGQPGFRGVPGKQAKDCIIYNC